MGFLQSILGKNKHKNCYSELAAHKVKDIMTRDVLCIHREDNLVDAAHTMIGAHVSCLVVLDEYKPIGIITERDFIKKMSMTEDSSEEMIVKDIMTRKLFTIEPDLDLFKAQEIMRNHNFRKLVIVEKDEIKGIITQTDLCRAVAGMKTMCPQPHKAKDAMTKKVLQVSEDDKFSKAKKSMSSKNIGSVVVTEKKEIKGIFTEFDIVSGFFLNPNKLRKSYMRELMSKPVICISPDFNLFEVNELMLKHNFRRLPVIDKGNLAGIITQTDIARHLYKFIQENKDEHEVKNKVSADYEIHKKGGMILYKKKHQEERDKKQRNNTIKKTLKKKL